MTNAPELVEGYPTIANGMGLMPETAILRRFATLNTQSLLYRQAEIIRLERELRALEARSHHTKPAADDPEPNNEYWYAKDWYYLGVQRPQNEQWQKFLVVQNKLEEYNHLVLQQAQMAALPNPDRIDLENLQRMFRSQKPLTGDDSAVWDDENDLLALFPRPTEDPFTSWVTGKLMMWLYDKLWCRVQRDRGMEAEGTTLGTTILRRATSLCATAVASILLVGSIAILYCVDGMRVRLGLVSAFTFVFALAVDCFTTASKSEVFAATAAFAAVQVVFISGNGIQPGQIRTS